MLIGANLVTFYQTNAASINDLVVIPDEAIRLRILANSDSKADQELKRLVRDEVNAEITMWVEDLTTIEAARNLIRNRLDKIEDIVQQTLVEEGQDQQFSVDYGTVNFPTKLYGNYLYPAGQYEAILISLGNAKGANWWCVLFPPLCFLDFSNGDAVNESATAETKTNEPEVKFFVAELFQSLWKKISSLV